MYIATDGKIFKVFNKKTVDSISIINDYKVDNIRKIKIIDNQIFLCGNSGVILISKNGNRILNKYNFLNSNEVFDVAKLENELFVATKKEFRKLIYNLFKINPKNQVSKF